MRALSIDNQAGHAPSTLKVGTIWHPKRTPTLTPGIAAKVAAAAAAAESADLEDEQVPTAEAAELPDEESPAAEAAQGSDDGEFTPRRRLRAQKVSSGEASPSSTS